jgi:hypothetical protein
MVPRRIFGHRRYEVIGKWRMLHNGELHNLYSSPDIRQIKSRIMRWAGHAACMGEGRNIQGFGGKTLWKKATCKTKA